MASGLMFHRWFCWPVFSLQEFCMLKKPSGCVVFSLFCVYLLFISCSQGSGGDPAGNAASSAGPPSEVESSAVIQAAPVPAVVLSRATLWVEKEGVMNPGTQAGKGDAVIWKNEVKNAPRSIDKETRDYARVEIDGKDYWIQSVLVASEAVPGVIIAEDTMRYSKALLTAPNSRGATIPLHSLVAVHTNQETGIFTGVSAYLDETRTVVAGEFIKKENVTISPADVQAMQLYSLALEAKTDVLKKEYLRNALDLDSRFNDIIEQELYGFAGANITTESLAAYDIAVVRPGCTVYEEPAIRSRDLGPLPVGSLVTVVERTENEVRLNSGDTARWYKIIEPAGWVFGAYLDANGAAEGRSE
jgi:hypothetical protein